MADQTRTTIPTPKPTTNHTPNRRQLLTGASALALSGAALAGAAFPGSALLSGAGSPVPLGQGFDPAYAAYLRARKAEDALKGYRGPKLDNYPDLAIACMKAQEALAATPASSLAGVRCKMKWFADCQDWQADGELFEPFLGLSILADLDRMTGQEGGVS